MIIYPLPPSELDDATLSKQIRNIAQVLCNVHHILNDEKSSTIGQEEYSKKYDSIPLHRKFEWEKPEFNIWARTCVANYKKLVEMGYAAREELNYRGVYYIEYKGAGLLDILDWARDNVPDLPPNPDIFNCYKFEDQQKASEYVGLPTLFPLVMGDKYKRYPLGVNTYNKAIEVSYRNLYRAKLNKRINKVKQQECGLCKDKMPHAVDVPAYPLPVWTRREPPSYLKDIL